MHSAEDEVPTAGEPLRRDPASRRGKIGHPDAGIEQI
jgi:hypothetical protein